MPYESMTYAFHCRTRVVEAKDRILPLYDEELTRPVAASLRKLGVQVLLGSEVQGRSIPRRVRRPI